MNHDAHEEYARAVMVFRTAQSTYEHYTLAATNASKALVEAQIADAECLLRNDATMEESQEARLAVLQAWSTCSKADECAQRAYQFLQTAREAWREALLHLCSLVGEE